MAIIC